MNGQADQRAASERSKKVAVVSTFALLSLLLGLIVCAVIHGGPGGGGGKGGTTSGSGEGDQTGDGNANGTAEAAAGVGVTPSSSETAARSAEPCPASEDPVADPIPFDPVTNFVLVDGNATRPSPPTASSRGGRDAGSGGGTGGGRGTGSGAGVGEAKFMGARAEGQSFVFIVDRSGSMGSDGRLEEAKAELTESIEGLRREQQFFIFFYDTVSEAMPGPASFRWATRDNKDDCGLWISSISPRGGTQPEQALVAAIRMHPDVIFLMSDGQFDEGVSDRVKTAQGKPPVVIHTICFVDPSGERVLRRIAEENGGKYTFNPGRLGRVRRHR